MDIFSIEFQFSIVLLRDSTLLFSLAVHLFLWIALTSEVDSTFFRRIVTRLLLIKKICLFGLAVIPLLKFYLLEYYENDVSLYYMLSFLGSCLCWAFFLFVYESTVKRNIKYVWVLWACWILTCSNEVWSLVVLLWDWNGNSLNRWLLIFLLLTSIFKILLIGSGLILYRASRIHHVLNSEIPSDSYVSIDEDDSLFNHYTLGDSKRMNDSWFSKISFSWVSPLFYSDQFSRFDNICKLENTLDMEVKFKNAWNSVFISSNNAKVDEYSIWKSLYHVFSYRWIILGLVKFFSDLLVFAGPILLQQLLGWMSNGGRVTSGISYAFGLIISSMLSVLISTQYNFSMSMLQLNVRSCLGRNIFSKLMILPQRCSSTALVVNHLDVDVQRVMDACSSFHEFWSLPIQVIVAIVLLYRTVGVAFLAGLSIMLIMIPLNTVLTKFISSATADMLKYKDQRLNLQQNLFSNIKSVKMMALELAFERKILQVRELEFKALSKRKYLDAFCVYFWATTPVLVSCSTFYLFVYLGNELTAPVVFSCLSLFNILIFPINAFPWIINGLVESRVSATRIATFFSDISINSSIFLKDHTEITEMAISFHNSSFNLGSDCKLIVGDLTIRKGACCGISGSVGAGKSSFLLSILGETEVKSGKCNVNDKIAYVGSDVWLQHGTVRDNILFGTDFEENRYNEVIFACCLNGDFEILHNRDLTEVLENGANLSGGQKVRIALARAVYSSRSIVILDDIFASLDENVKKFILRHIISESGILRNRTRVISTHYQHAFNFVDQLISLDNCKIVSNINVVPLNLTLEPIDEYIKVNEFSPDDSIKVNEEEQQSGTISLGVLSKFLSCIGYIFAGLIFLSLIIMQVSRNGSDFFLTYYLNNSILYSTSTWLMFLAILAAINSFITLIRSFIFAYGFLNGSYHMFNCLITSVINAPLKVFEFTPIGRLLSRFAGDTFSVDDSLPFQANILFAQVFSLAGFLVVLCVSTPFILVLFIPLGVVYFYLQRYYRATTRELKRIDSVTRGKLFVVVSETAAGLTTIRAFEAQDRILISFVIVFNRWQELFYAQASASQWLSFRLQCIGLLIVIFLSIYAVLSNCKLIPSFLQGVGGTASIGLSLTYAYTLTNALNAVIGAFTETEKETVSVERIVQFLQFPSETVESSGLNEACRKNDNISQSLAVSKVLNVDISWPEFGQVEFRNVFMKYNESSPNVLSNISFHVYPGMFLGIIGKTGSGKSSITEALLQTRRLTTSGMILIDNIDVTKIDPRLLRSKVSVVPQKACLFQGSVRLNLVPFEIDSVDEDSSVDNDDALWDVLEKCGLKTKIIEQGGLDSIVDIDGGFSSGEKQLLCFARTLLLKSKLIILDEASSDVDQVSDLKLQKLLHSFRLENQCSVIMIAHRLENVANADEIIVLNCGEIVNSGPPSSIIPWFTSQ